DLNCSESLGCYPQGAVSIPLKPRTYLSGCLGTTGRDERSPITSGPLFRLTSVPNSAPPGGCDFGGARLESVICAWRECAEGLRQQAARKRTRQGGQRTSTPRDDPVSLALFDLPER